MGTRGPKPGTRVGGRRKGTPNRRTQAIIAAVAETGISPLDYLLQVMRDPAGDAGARLEAAKAAAPYVHPKLSAIEHSTDPANAMAITLRTRQAVLQDIMDEIDGSGRGLPSAETRSRVPS